MSLHRRIEDAEPLGPGTAGPQEIRRTAESGHLASGTIACPACDAPVAPDGVVTPAEPMSCPYCAHAGAVRDFLTLGAPSRPARVVVRVVVR